MAIIIGRAVDGGGHWGSGVRIVGDILYLTGGLGRGRRLVDPSRVGGSGSRRRSGSGVRRIPDTLRGDTIM